MNNAPTDKQAEALIRERFQFVNNDRCPLSPRIRVLRDEIVAVDYSVTRLIQKVAGSGGRSALVPVIFSSNIFPHPATFELRDLAALVLGGGRDACLAVCILHQKSVSKSESFPSHDF